MRVPGSPKPAAEKVPVETGRPQAMKSAFASANVSGGRCTIPYRPTARGMRTCKSTLRAPAPPGSHSRRRHRREVGTCYGQTLRQRSHVGGRRKRRHLCDSRIAIWGPACRMHAAFTRPSFLGMLSWWKQDQKLGVTGWRAVNVAGCLFPQLLVASSVVGVHP
jgi:hypothetical protein